MLLLLKTVRKLNEDLSTKWGTYANIFGTKTLFPFEGWMEKDPDRWQDSSRKLLSTFFYEKRRIWHEIMSHLGLFFHTPLHLFTIDTNKKCLKQSCSGEQEILKLSLAKFYLQELIWICSIYHQSCKKYPASLWLVPRIVWSTCICQKWWLYEYQCCKCSYSFKLWDVYSHKLCNVNCVQWCTQVVKVMNIINNIIIITKVIIWWQDLWQ